MPFNENNVIVVTGSDTGVGKTVISILLCRIALRLGKQVVGLKPFSSGDRHDARSLVWAANGDGGELEHINLINPWHFSRPVAPCVAAGASGEIPQAEELHNWILQFSQRSKVTIIEGAGGLLSPLGTNYTVMDVGMSLGACFACVINNKIGAINQARLCYEVLKSRGLKDFVLILNQTSAPDESSNSNAQMIVESCPEARVATLPRIPGLHTSEDIQAVDEFLKNSLQISEKLINLFSFGVGQQTTPLNI